MQSTCDVKGETLKTRAIVYNREGSLALPWGLFNFCDIDGIALMLKRKGTSLIEASLNMDQMCMIA